MSEFETFERAFSSRSDGCRRTCECGREFYDSWNRGWTWDAGELEGLHEDPNATPVLHSVGSLVVSGVEYCMDCDCWHKAARQIISFIKAHDHSITLFLTLEKKRLQSEADRAPEVEP